MCRGVSVGRSSWMCRGASVLGGAVGCAVVRVCWEEIILRMQRMVRQR